MDRFSQAIDELKAADVKNITHIANKYGLDRSALSRRFRGVTKSASQHHQSQQNLTPPQEQQLIQWIKTLSKRGIPPTPLMLRNLCFEISGHEPGNHWPRRFVLRNKEHLDSGYLNRLDRQR
jgi:hypothetical protein